MIIYDPRQPVAKRGKTYEEMVLNVDIPSTILDVAGVSVPESYQGKSLVPFNDDSPKDWRTSGFFEHQRAGVSLLPKTEGYRDNDTWKFIRYEANPEYMELYNLKDDFIEANNLATNPKISDILSKNIHESVIQ